MIDTSNNTITTTNALLYKIEDGLVKFLLAQENDDNWGLPGGAKEVEDTDLLQTIQRELKEELELEPEDYILEDIGVRREFEYNHFQSSRFGKHGIVCFYLIQLKNEAKINVSSEIKAIAWMTADEAISKLTFEHIKDGFAEASRKVRLSSN